MTAGKCVHAVKNTIKEEIVLSVPKSSGALPHFRTYGSYKIMAPS